ncbi:PorP/SprF family type IX secretion system membrane protein [Adhaeribacter rhizoryzae]|uniref:Type IX secretion system membrane protein PorP/SprF n=1 Tax=Adhaeribacter rhizoryzae TaxID=2607907 RepID=A0A5M6DHC4_9BACT|nr:type IX secretion system membrane protein PorP/SprF [Adhaeribacter rhizoryzae]KAA5545662.1 type IX secretion system membrane protein PorP/SprF [Adhaeribacter rhizoryzae]
MKKTFYAFFLSLLFTGTTSLAQQLPQFSHYGFNGMYLSPGYAGITGQAELNGLFRYQWAGYQGSFDAGGAPRTGLFSLSLPVNALRGGVGAYVVQDQLGATKMTNVALSYSQHIKIGAGKLGIGVQGGMMRIRKGEYRANDPGDPSVPENSADRKFDAGAGIWYHSEKFYFGAGINNLLRSKYVFEDSLGVETPDAGNITAENHLHVTGGYNYEVNPGLVLTPTAIVKYDFNKISFEGGVRGTFNQKFWLGAGYRYQEAITGMAGAYLLKDNTLRLGYGLDLTNFGVEAKARTSHEIMLSYIFPKPANIIKPPVKTPRYSF